MLTGVISRRIAGGLAIALALSLVWSMRLDALRGRYRAQLDGVVVAIAEVAGVKVDRGGAANAVRAIALQRDRRRLERDDALARIERQSNEVNRLGREGRRLAEQGARDRELARALSAQRDEWIRRVAAAETREQRLSADRELAECEEVLDALYHDGF